MSFQIELDKFEEAYGHFMRDIRLAIQRTFAEEAESRNLTQADIANELETDPSVVSRRLNGAGNVTLRTICDLYTAMGREPLSNFSVRDQDERRWIDSLTIQLQNTVVITSSRISQQGILDHEVGNMLTWTSLSSVRSSVYVGLNQELHVLKLPSSESADSDVENSLMDYNVNA